MRADESATARTRLDGGPGTEQITGNRVAGASITGVADLYRVFHDAHPFSVHIAQTVDFTGVFGYSGEIRSWSAGSGF